MESPEYVAVKELVPAASADVVQLATPELTTLVAQPTIEVLPSLKFTVPVAPEVNVAVRVIGVFTFSGPKGEAVSAVVDVPSAGAVAAELLADALGPPELQAITLNVYEVAAVSPGTVHVRLGAATAQLNPPGLDATE